jgi:hypothetical protein
MRIILSNLVRKEFITDQIFFYLWTYHGVDSILFHITIIN